MLIVLSFNELPGITCGNLVIPDTPGTRALASTVLRSFKSPVHQSNERDSAFSYK